MSSTLGTVARRGREGSASAQKAGQLSCVLEGLLRLEGAATGSTEDGLFLEALS